MPPRLVGDWVELTDLFLDLWVSPDLRYNILDEEELEEALQNGWVTEQLYQKAKSELEKLVYKVEKGRFPPRLVRDLERKFYL